MTDQQPVITRFIKPISDLMIINAETTGEILLRQTSAFSELVQAGVENARKAAAAPTLAEAARTRFEFMREVMAKANDVNRGNWESIRSGFAKSRDRLRGVDSSADAADAA